MSPQRREHARIHVELTVDFESEHTFYAGSALNLAVGGLFIATPNPLPVGYVVSLKLALPTGRIAAEAEVMWTAEAPPESRGLSGMGVRFRDISAVDKVRVEAFIEQRAPMIYEEEESAEVDESDVGDLDIISSTPATPERPPAASPARAPKPVDDLDAGWDLPESE